MYTYGTSISVHTPHMNSLHSIISPGTLIYIHMTLLAYAPEQTCLPHCIYMTHCTVVNVQTHIIAHISQKQPTATIVSQAIAIYVLSSWNYSTESA